MQPLQRTLGGVIPLRELFGQVGVLDRRLAVLAEEVAKQELLAPELAGALDDVSTDCESV